MVIVQYYRKETDVNDARCFRNIDELNDWLLIMKELGEEYYITHIDYED